MRYYQDGGVVAPEMDIDPEKGNAVNQWLAQKMGQRPGGTANADPESKIADSHPGLQAVPSPAPVGGGVPPSPPPVSDQLTPYIKEQEKQVDTFGPEKQAALMQHLQQGYKSPGNLIAKGGATLADAIMQGVARAGSSGNLAAINERENQQLNRTAEMGKNLNEQQQAALKAKQGLEQMSGKTPLGATEQLATKLLAQKMFPNLKPDQLEALTQNPQALSKYFPSIAEYNKAMAEIANTAEFRKESLANQRLGLEQTGEHQKAETIQGSARALESRGVLERVRDALSPSPETKALQQNLSGGGGGQSSGPFGPKTVKDGKTYVWFPSTGKYHKQP